MISTQVNIPGYQVSEEIYNGSRTIVYRAFRETDSLPVVIKLLKNPYPNFNELVQFRNQYTIAKNLKHPGIIQTYSLEAYQNGYLLVMEDFGGISLKEYFAKNNYIASLEELLLITISLCDTLNILYRHRIIHKDIKPSNILINPETKQVKLIDFSIASLLHRETQTLMSPNVLEGTLAYLSPEQTGRMNRGIDYRTDFYSLGVTFYELLTGKLPFESNDPMELVYCHIAQQVSVLPNNESIPQVISDIIIKLMAKNAEDRYQSALGLKHDLEKCLYQLKEAGKIEDFPIAQRDICDGFIIPDKLYGRETEIETLLQAFERVSRGAVEMMLVAGFSGIGKTAVVNEVHKPIVRQRGYFIKGKFDQFNRNIPLSAFVQAFRNLMGQLLTENNAQIQHWKTKILEAVGENGQVIVEVIPELEKIIGIQAAVPELSGTAAQNRFNLLFQKFIQVFTSKEHPLVMFLDDLQWADSASLKLMQLLMADTEHLFVIGAYRDNEVNPTHPLMLTLSEIEKTAATINTITLAPLNQSKLNELVAETLKCQENLALPLTELIYQKTQGNPFFATQFLKALHQDGLIKFDFDLGCWQCDIAAVTQRALTSDVVEFMALQLQKLPESTQDVLKLAACIGNPFDLETLAIVHQKSLSETAADLWVALQEEFILPLTEVYKFYITELNTSSPLQTVNPSVNYKFLHDRIQQATYSLIPDDIKPETHLKIGRLLLENTPESQRSDKLFDIVNQLNIGASLIETQDERNQLAELNLQAAQKAKASTAYKAAVEYLSIGLELLDFDRWQTQYNLTFHLHLELAEAEYLTYNFDSARDKIEAIFKHGKDIIDKSLAYEIKIQMEIAQEKMQDAIDTSFDVLKELEIDLKSELENPFAIEDLINQPIMTAPTKLAAMRILMAVVGAAYVAKPELLQPITVTMVQLSINFGNSPISAFAYVFYGVLLCGFFGDIELGYQFGKLSLKVLEKFEATTFKSKVYHLYYSMVRPWKEHTKSAIEPLLESVKSGVEMGDQEYATYSIADYCNYKLLTGEALDSLNSVYTQYLELSKKLKPEYMAHYVEIRSQIPQNLLQDCLEQPTISLLGLDEDEMLQWLKDSQSFIALLAAYLSKAFLCYLFQDYAQAVEYYGKSVDYISYGVGKLYASEHNFYYSLALLGLATQADNNDFQSSLDEVEKNQKQLKIWADSAPMNFLHKFYLVEAERHRVLGNLVEAMHLYDRSIALAKENEYFHEEALADELAAKFYLNWGKEKVASGYMQEAYYGYARWGAKAKVADLEKRYPELLATILKQPQIPVNLSSTMSNIASTSVFSSSTSISETLDLTTVLKASQALSSEIKLEDLLSNLMQIVMENAGADKCALMLFKDNNLTLEATATLQAANTKIHSTLLQSIPVESSSDIPVSVINYVSRTNETLVIDDAMAQTFFASDSYLQQQQPKSILSTPIINQGKLIGILYLENNFTIGAFKRDRLQVIQLLTAQAAISLENAQLYSQLEDYSQSLEEKVSQRTQELQQKTTQIESTLKKLYATQAQLIQAEKMSGLGQLVAGIAHEINNPINFIYGNLQPASEYVTSLIELNNLYLKNYPQTIPEIEEKIEDIELDFLINDLQQLLKSMKIGADRIRQIVLSLRNFSRLDEAEIKSVDIHEGIDSTLLILQHRFKDSNKKTEISLIKEYSQIPLVNCYPSTLNQVFMNILSNAIYALKELDVNHKPTITIRTAIQEQKYVSIHIIDNGMGISESVKNKMFEPFFTTKPVGSGTGLGLSVSYSIVVEQHGGQLNCISSPGKGAEFVIQIPLST